MLSETYHSISDTGNQVFLLIGIRYSRKEPDSKQPFGYGKAQFFYSFLVSVLLFGIAGWESAKHGYQKIVEGGHTGPEGPPTIPFTGIELGFDPIFVVYAVLIGAILFESWALWKANQGMKARMNEKGWTTYREAFRKTSDVTTLTAFTEDSIALAGAGIALVGIFLSRQLGMPIIDAAAALLIGLLLMGFAVALAWENKRLLLGESLPDDEERRLREVALGWDGVEDVADFRTVYFGPDQVVVTADIVFEEGMATTEIDTAITDIESGMKDAENDLSAVYIEPET
jgi:cation diffusion facilitator family transporter